MKIVSENRFSGKTHFYTFASRSGNRNNAQQQSGFLGSGKVTGIMVPSAFETREIDDEDDIPKKQIKVDGTVMVVSAEEAISTTSFKEPMAVDLL